MIVDLVLAGGVVAGLLFYLIQVLLWPERL